MNAYDAGRSEKKSVEVVKSTSTIDHNLYDLLTKSYLSKEDADSVGGAPV